MKKLSKRGKKFIKETIINFFFILSLTGIAYLGASYINTIAHNNSDQKYASWNAFEILLFNEVE